MTLIAVPIAELGSRFRGWRLPCEFGEEIGPDHRGVNPFTKEEVVFLGRRSPIGPAPVADPDAIDHPRVDDLPAVALPDEIYGESLDDLARVVFGWSVRYALGEISDRWLEGGEDRHDYFNLVPRRVVDAVAALSDDAVPSVAATWSKRYDLPLELAMTWLPRIRAFFRETSRESLVLLWGTR